MCDQERIRLVILGGPGVGKSCIVKRFLFNTFTDRYRSTVEDLYNREFDLGPVTIKVDILDTCGDLQFPAMRRLSIATAHAFLLVYAITSADSFERMKCCFEEVREQRGDFQEIPIMVAGNKLDLAPARREVSIEDVSEWLFCEQPKLRAKLMECSAKDDLHIRDIFRCFVTLSRILPPSGEDSGGLKRRSSAYVRQGAGRRGGSPATTSSTACSATGDTAAAIPSNAAPAKPRSRSLIRRCSRKAKQQIRDAQGTNNDDCNVS
ncbi:hypothetical protein LSTR_LSTR001142 [Laodelphax striatellus]|uniref:GTP-binding protein Di-Ras2 n=1 Tax=Laodelphax striatellus TaxID=195883 RepID=A0A482X2Z4_LAOST|nr:hypothetical protein LSTR_LSTR001142 [Laodelphax striatellus]